MKVLHDPDGEICFIINPISGGKKKRTMERILLEHFPHYKIRLFHTQAPQHGWVLAREAVARGAAVVAVVGGDGSINEACQSMIHTPTALAIIPKGSGNGLAKHLHIPLETEKALLLIQKGYTTHIDTLLVNDRYALSVAGIGFDAEVGWAFAEFGHRGFFSYLLMTLKKLPAYKPRQYTLSIDGKRTERKAFFIAFANGSQFGNDACIAPQAQLDDGYLDVIIVKKIPFYATAQFIHQLFHGSLDHSPYVEIIRCKTVEIQDSHLKAHIDGEPVTLSHGMKIQLIPSSLKIVVPEPSFH